jgi:hypothetical protein
MAPLVWESRNRPDNKREMVRLMVLRGIQAVPLRANLGHGDAELYCLRLAWPAGRARTRSPWVFIQPGPIERFCTGGFY